MAQNMYRVGDFVYFEVSSSSPYQIRRIEELNKIPSGAVEAKVALFYRRRDVSSALLKIADQAERRFEEYYDMDKSKPDNFLGGTGHTIANGSETEEHKIENSKATAGPDSDKKTKEDMKEEWGLAGLPLGAESLDVATRHKLRQRELYLSRQVENLPATQIRGKCHVTLLSEIETAESYLADDSFFYSLVYDPMQMTLLADKGAIRVGEKYQAVVPPGLAIPEENTEIDDDIRDSEALMIDEGSDRSTTESPGNQEEKNRESLVYHPYHNLSDRDIDQFLILARAVGTFSRALDTSSSMKLPSLHMTAAAASRDVTIFHAMALLHQSGYDIGQTVKFLVPPPNKNYYPLETDRSTGYNTTSLGGPILCRDQMEEWSASEANLFEEAMEKYGKDFTDIKADFLPWKSIKDIVEYYYMWKTTNRYVDQKKRKQQEQENKLKQVYIPNYNKPSPNLVGQLNTSTNLHKGTVPCEGCKVSESTNWYAWGPAHLQLRLCNDCWILWKKNGGLKEKNEYETYDLDGATENVSRAISTNVNPLSINKTISGQNRPTGSGQVSQIIARLPPNQQSSTGSSSSQHATNKQALKGPFSQFPSIFTRIMRKSVPKTMINLKKSARNPFNEINTAGARTHCLSQDMHRLFQIGRDIRGDDLPQTIKQLIATIQVNYQQNLSKATNGTKRTHDGGEQDGPSAKKIHS